MRSGYKIIYDLLRQRAIRGSEAIGLVFGSSKLLAYLDRLGFTVEGGMYKPYYEFVYLNRNSFTIPNILEALTSIRIDGIIISIVKEVDIENLQIELLTYGFRTKISKFETSNGNFVVQIEKKGSAYEAQYNRPVI